MSEAAAGSEGIEGVCVCACFSERNWVSGCVVYLAVNGAPSLLLFVGAWVGCWWSLGLPHPPLPFPQLCRSMQNAENTYTYLAYLNCPGVQTRTRPRPARPVPTKAEQSWARQCPMLNCPPKGPHPPKNARSQQPSSRPTLHQPPVPDAIGIGSNGTSGFCKPG